MIRDLTGIDACHVLKPRTFGCVARTIRFSITVRAVVSVIAGASCLISYCSLLLNVVLKMPLEITIIAECVSGYECRLLLVDFG